MLLVKLNRGEQIEISGPCVIRLADKSDLCWTDLAIVAAPEVGILRSKAKRRTSKDVAAKQVT